MIDNITLKIKNAVNKNNLDLNGKVVLTEAATGAYCVTPILAAVAGAKVYAYTKDTKYGSVEDVKSQTYEIAKKLFVEDKISIITNITEEIISKADVITNTGHLRPIDKTLLNHAKKGVVIPYMYEDWEFRNEDLDLDFCHLNNINVVATNERHHNIDVFSYLGELAIKQIHDSGKCVYGNKFIVISNNDFGPYIANTLYKIASKVGVIDLNKRKSFYSKEIDWLGEFPNLNIPLNYNDVEAIIFTAYPFDQTWFSNGGELDINQFSKLNVPFVLRYAGDIDLELFKENKINYFPEVVKSGHMGILLSDIGYDSIINLQAGGLKVAELALKDEYIYENCIIGVKL